MLINLKDGGIKKFATNSDFESGGCSTCDFGSSYISTINIELTSINIDIDISKSYDYPLSDEFLMTTILPNYESIKTLTEHEFAVWFKGKIEEEIGWDLNEKEYNVY